MFPEILEFGLAIEIISTCEELNRLVSKIKSQSKTIGVVATMGALHEGHLSLARQAVNDSDVVIATIFLNPTQFAAGEDLSTYPKPLQADIEKLDSVGVPYVFAPSNDEIYPPEFTTTVVPPKIAKLLEGEFRPTHFSGVATVVLKLLNLTQADIGYFGQKDFQQVMVIKQMVADLNVPTEIRVCPIVRETDGLALSSRNAYLSDDERQIALSLNRTLDHVEDQIRSGLRDGFEAITEMRQMLIDAGVDSIDYAILADPNTLQTVDSIQLPVVALIAAHVGTTRLIDNRLIQ